LFVKANIEKLTLHIKLSVRRGKPALLVRRGHIRSLFPALRGFSVRNLKYMAKFARIYGDSEKVQQVLHNLPWRHNIALMERLEEEKRPFTLPDRPQPVATFQSQTPPFCSFCDYPR